MDAETSIFSQANYFLHIRIIAGIFVSLCMSRILMDIVKYIQFPKRYRFNYLHIAWLLYFVFYIIDWWWDIFEYIGPLEFSYRLYILIVINASSLYFLAAIITPSELNDYDNFEDYFMGIRKWFYSIFIINMITSEIDYIATLNFNIYDYLDITTVILTCFLFAYAAYTNSVFKQRVVATITLVLQVFAVGLGFFL